mgnify:CR=1 FL=1
MAATNTASKGKDLTKKNKLWKVTPLRIAVGVILLIIGLFVWWFFGGGITMSNQREMEAYLESKYNKDFVVERPQWKGSGIGVRGTLSADAYPSDDKSIRFIVSQGSSDTWDSYPSTVWETEERPKVKAKLATIFPETQDFDLDMGARELEMTMKGPVPEFEDFSKDHKEDIVYVLRINTPTLSQEQVENYAPAFVNYLAQKNAQVTLGIYFNDKGIVMQPSEVTEFAANPGSLNQYIKSLPASMRRE